MLGQLDTPEGIVIADFEAGLGTVSRLKPGQVDLLLVVAEPTAKAVDVARRGLAMIQERGLGRASVIGNRVNDDDDRALLREAFADEPLVLIPEDPAVRHASLHGGSPVDTAGAGPAVRELRAFAAGLLNGADAPGI